MSLTAYIRYDHTGRIVPGGPIVVKDKPAVGNWQNVTEGTNVTLSGKLRAFVKVDRFGKPIASSLFLGKNKPATGKWVEVNAEYTIANSSTTTTTTTFVSYALPIYQGKNSGAACAGGTPIVAYINTPTFSEGVAIYTDLQCTTPLSNVGAVVLQTNPINVYSTNASGVTTLVGQCP